MEFDVIPEILYPGSISKMDSLMLSALKSLILFWFWSRRGGIRNDNLFKS
jgi:hypothetical protein